MNTLQRLACLVLALAVTMLSQAQAAPRLEVIGGLKQELGSFSPGKHTGAVYIINTGDETLEISTITSSCTCFYGHTACTSVAPGDTCAIEWDMTNRGNFQPGPTKRSLTLITNDPDNPSTVVVFTWTIVVELQPEPGSAFIVLKPNAARTLWIGEAQVRNVGSDTITISVPEMTRADGLEQVKLLPRAETKLPPGEVFTVSIQAKRGPVPAARAGAAPAPLPPVDGAVTLKSSSRFSSLVSLDVIVVQ